MDVPVLGTQGDPYPATKEWQASLSWRWQRSDRHFVGSDEQENRAEEGSEVVNDIHLLELGLRYQLTRRWSVALGIPFLLAERSNPIRDPDGVVIDRSVTQARGVGDVTCTFRRWMLEPDRHPSGNVSFGFGVKLPTGQDNTVDTRRRFDEDSGQIVPSVETVDQSIQPGDGGFGLIVDLQAFRRLGRHSTFYFSGGYLSNPDDTNGVQTYRSRVSEAEMSVADQYLARSGVSFGVPRWPGISLSLGGRLEGVPAYDLLGDSNGFRRPGYAVSVEPALAWSRGPNTISLAVPIAAYRNRVRSVPDRREDRHGDAAFADYVVLLGYWHRF